MTRFVLDARSATDHFPGIGRYVSNLARALAGQLAPGEQLDLLRQPQLASRWQLPDASSQLAYLDQAASPFGLSQQWRVPRQLRQAGVELYHSPYYLMPYRVGAPTVLTVYDLIPLHFPAHVALRARLLYRLAHWLAIRQADHLFAISEATRQDFIQYFKLDPARISTTPLAPDPRFSPPSPAEQERVRQLYHLPEQYVLYFGINKPHKNLVRLVQAWAKLVRRNQAAGAVLCLAGAWDARYPQARQLVDQLDLAQQVRFLGPVPEADLPGLYAAALAFVFPSLSEGFGLPVLEAMACGTPVACSQTSSLPEVGGQAALYFDPQQVAEIADRLADLLHEPATRLQLQQRGLQQAASFTWGQTAAQTLAVYRQISHT
ncbi:MAG: glycosyltransferase family 4 protein [Anaerolineales bacterium]|nr:glycosyltransferase family 4 protein [Anaerolineales bacterium]